MVPLCRNLANIGRHDELVSSSSCLLSDWLSVVGWAPEFGLHNQSETTRARTVRGQNAFHLLLFLKLTVRRKAIYVALRTR